MAKSQRPVVMDRLSSSDIKIFYYAYKDMQNGYLRAGSNYSQVERRSVTFLDQTMPRREVFGLIFF